MTTERIDIIVSERGSRTVKRNIQEIGNTAVSATRGLRLLQNALFVLGGAGILQGIVRNLDTLNSFRNRLRLVTDSMGELNKVQKELFDISNRTRTAFSATATVFTRTAFNTKELGLSMKETLDFTEALNKAVLISGANAREAEAAMVQLSQAIASDRFSGDELRSVLEQLPFAADVIAEGVNATRGELRQMGKDGEITASRIIQAFLKATDKIDGLFGQLVSTVSQSFSVLDNKFLEFLSGFDEFTGFSDKLITAITAIGDNLETIIPVALGVAAVLLTRFLGPLIARFGEAIKAEVLFTQSLIRGEVALAGSAKATLINAKADDALALAELRVVAAKQASIKTQITNNNLTIAGTRIKLAQVAADVQLQKGIAVATGQTSVLNRLLATQSAQRQILTQAIRVNSAAKVELAAASSSVARAEGIAIVTTNTLTGAMAGATFGARVLSGALGLLRGALALVGGVGGLVLLAATAWLVFGRSTNTATIANKSQENSLTALNDKLLQNVSLTRRSAEALDVKAEKALSELLARSIFEENITSGLEAEIKRKTNELQILENAIRKTSSIPSGILGFSPEALNVTKAQSELAGLEEALNNSRNASKKLEDQTNELGAALKENSTNKSISASKALEKLEASLNGVFAAQQRRLKLNKQLDVLEKEGKLGRTDEASAAKRLELNERFNVINKEALNPLKFLNEELQFENSLLGKSSTERSILNKVRSETIRLQQAGAEVSGREVEGTIRLNESVAQQISLLDSVNGSRDAFNEGLITASSLLESGAISLSKYEDILRALKITELEQGKTFGVGLARGLLKVEEKLRDVASVADNLVVNAFQGAEDALVNFVTTGKLSFTSLINSMIADLARLAIKQAIGSIFGKIFGSVVGALTGNPASAISSLVPDFSNSINPVSFAGAPGFANGGSFNVGGSGGTDSQLVSFRASPNERVTIETPKQQRGGGVTNIFKIDARGAEVGVEERIIAGIKQAAPFIINQAREASMGDFVELVTRRNL